MPYKDIEDRRARDSRYHQAHRELRLAQMSAQTRLHREKRRAYGRAHRLAHLDEYADRLSAWRMTAKGMTSSDRTFLRKAGVLPPYYRE